MGYRCPFVEHGMVEDGDPPMHKFDQLVVSNTGLPTDAVSSGKVHQDGEHRAHVGLWRPRDVSVDGEVGPRVVAIDPRARVTAHGGPLVNRSLPR
jgi:hypothetical protein